MAERAGICHNGRSGQRRAMKNKELERLFAAVMEAAPPSNETEVEYNILGPALEALGWDKYSQIAWRHRTGGEAKGEGGVVDASLHSGNGVPRVLLEAKAWDADLTRHMSQMLRYAFHEAAEVCVLTNGKEWRFYLPRARGEVKDRMFAHAHLELDGTAGASAVVARYLSAERVLDGTALEDAERSLGEFKAKREAVKILPRVWDKMRADADRDLLRLVTRRVEAETGQPPPADKVAEVIRQAQPIPGTHTRLAPEPETDMTPRRVAAPPTPSPERVLTSDKTLEAGSWKKATEAVVAEVSRRHPGSDKWNELRFVRAEPPKHAPLEVSPGAFIGLSLNASNHRRLMGEVLKTFGEVGWRLEFEDGHVELI